MRLHHPDLPGQPIDVPEPTAQTLMDVSGWLPENASDKPAGSAAVKTANPKEN